MNAKILSLNSGHPAPLEWDGKSVTSSIIRAPVPGPLVVHGDHIEGNSFGAPNLHGLEHSVLYAFGLESALAFVRALGLERYEPGYLGENVTLDALDEAAVSVGDVFEFGEVLAQASYPRIPCNRVSYRTKNPDGQKALQRCGRSGVYFRVLRPGKIHLDSPVRLAEKAAHRFPVADFYRKSVANLPFTDEEKRLGLANGAFPQKILAKWRAELS
jgi:MOSC domain-containing protein YiiM